METSVTKYSEELKSKVIKQLLPPESLSVRELSEKEGIPEGTLYTWRHRNILNGITMPSKKSSSTNWTPEQKLAVVVETYSMNAEQLNEYCRGKGLYSDQVKSWKKASIDGHHSLVKNTKLESEKLKQSCKKIRRLEKELHRKEKALAEAAALLTLGKKYDALWAEKEES